MPAGSVQIVLSVDQANYTKAMAEAQRQLDVFAGKSKRAGHTSVSSIQATSAALRALHGGFEYNIRAVERWIGQSKIASGIAKSMFPVIGAVTFGYMIGQVGKQVYDFIQKARQMPAALQQGFQSLSMQTVSATDSLRLTNDELQNSINKLEGKRQNNLAIEIDETRVAADKLAKSIDEDSDKITALLEKNAVSSLAGFLTFSRDTSVAQGTAKYFQAQNNNLSYQYQQAVHGGDKTKIDAALKALNGSNAAWLKDAQQHMAEIELGYKQLHPGDNKAVSAGLSKDAAYQAYEGVANELLSSQPYQTELTRNSKLKPQRDAAEAAHAASLKAHAAQKQEAVEERQAWEASAQQAQRIADVLDRFSTGFMADFYKSAGLSKTDSDTLMQRGHNANAFITTLRQSIDLQQQQSDALAENSIQMALATGQMTQLDAARATAAMHTQDYTDSLKDLQEQRRAIAGSPQYAGDPLARKAALQGIDNQITTLNNNRYFQAQQDRLATNPSSTSALVGATDALNEFVAASRDGAAMMHDLVSNTLGSLNNQVVTAMTGGRTSFRQMGIGIFSQGAGDALQKAEGSALSALGFGGHGKLGTKSNPMYVQMATSASSAVSGLASHLKGMFGKAGGFLTSLLPHFAGGGAISPNTLSVVGENGPELFASGTPGTVIPNHQISSYFGGSSQNVTYHIDARGTDPVLVGMHVRTAIAQSHQSSIKQSLQQQQEKAKRMPQRMGR